MNPDSLYESLADPPDANAPMPGRTNVTKTIETSDESASIIEPHIGT